MSVSLETMPITSRVPVIPRISLRGVGYTGDVLAILHPGSHVELQICSVHQHPPTRRRTDLRHRRNRHAFLVVRARDLARSEETVLLRRIPVELDRRGRAHARARERAERGEDRDRARAVVVRARRARQWLAVVLAVLVRADSVTLQRLPA
jgi:hypothetical protein